MTTTCCSDIFVNDAFLSKRFVYVFSSCKPAPPNGFDLQTYNIVLFPDVDYPGVYNFYLADAQFSLLAQAEIKNGGWEIVNIRSVEPGFIRTVSEDRKTLFIATTGDNTGILWSFTIRSDNLIQSQVCAPPFGFGGIPVNPEENPPVGCPLVEGLIWSSPDNQQLCQFDYKVTTFSTACADCSCWASKCDSATQRVLEYKVYCPNFRSVLKKNCDLLELASYIGLRFILAKIVFGDFNVQYLRQCYYQPLLKGLRASQFCRFAAYLQASPQAKFCFKK